MKKLIGLMTGLAIFLVVVSPVWAYLIEDAGELWWDDPAVSPGGGYVEVFYDGPPPYLVKHTKVLTYTTGEIAWEKTLRIDIDPAALAAPGTGPAITGTQSITYETNAFANGILYEAQYCNHWDIGETTTATIEFPRCLKPIDDDGNLVAVDADCCWAAGVFTGTGGTTIYLPFICKNWGLPPERP